MERLYFIMCHISVLALMVGAGILLSKKYRDEYRYVASTFLLILCVICLRIISMYNGVAVYAGISLNTLMIGLFSITAYSVYPFQQLFPRYLAKAAIHRLFSPFFISLVIIYLLHTIGYKFQPFTMESLLENSRIYRFDIMFSLFVGAVTIIIAILPIIISIIRRLRGFIMIYSALSWAPAIFTVSLFVSIDKHYSALLAYQIWILFFVITIVSSAIYYQAKRDRARAESAEDELSSEDRLWSHLEYYMKQNEPWRNPDIRIEELSRQLHSNRTTISTLIHNHGYNSFQDYVAEYRIDAFCKHVEKNYINSISELFLDIGFKSTGTAFKHFKRIHNMTPSQYLKSIPLLPPPPKHRGK